MALPANRPRSFPKESRLCARHDFVRLSQSGAKHAGRHFLLLIDTLATGRSRIGITVTRKVGGAVVRNRIKRLVRECFRLTSEHWPKADIVVIARRSAANLTFVQVRDDLGQVLQRVRG